MIHVHLDGMRLTVSETFLSKSRSHCRRAKREHVDLMVAVSNTFLLDLFILLASARAVCWLLPNWMMSSYMKVHVSNPVGFAGWSCSDDTNALSTAILLTSVLLLTLSNLFFIPAIVLSFRRGFYSQCLLYLVTMFFSTVILLSILSLVDILIISGYVLPKFSFTTHATNPSLITAWCHIQCFSSVIFTRP